MSCGICPLCTAPPTEGPIELTTDTPTALPTEIVDELPTILPTEILTQVPTALPTEFLSNFPTSEPIDTDTPTKLPTYEPTHYYVNDTCCFDSQVNSVNIHLHSVNIYLSLFGKNSWSSVENIILRLVNVNRIQLMTIQTSSTFKSRTNSSQV